MKHILPGGYPDELLSGLIARYVHSLGLQSIRELRFSQKDNGPDELWPCGLAGVGAFVRESQYPDKVGVVRDLLFQHSVMPYALPLMNSFAARHFVELLSRSTGPSLGNHLVHRVFGKRRKEGGKHVLQYCIDCVQEDIQKFGEPYWHRVHQLPCTAVCTIHGRTLAVLATKSALVPGPPVRRASGPERLCTPFVQELARRDALMLNAFGVGFIGNQLYDAYQRRLRSSTSFVRGITRFINKLHSPKLQLELTCAGLEHLLNWSPGTYCADINECHHWRGAMIRHVFLTTLLNVDIDGLLTKALPHATSALYRDVDICGSASCRSFRSDWQSVMLTASRQPNTANTARCFHCGFSARVSSDSEKIRIYNLGKSRWDAKAELAREGILSREERIVLGGDSARAYAAWRGRRPGRCTRRSPATLKRLGLYETRELFRLETVDSIQQKDIG